jgi:hypothetical protein
MSRRNRIPIALKVVYSAYIAVLVPFYWVTYSPWNFLYFCDLALLLTLPALWLESPLLISLPAVGIFVPQMLWVADLLSGARIVTITSYMFDPGLTLFVRGLSTFHGWLPFLLLWGVRRLGYDRRAFAGWTILAIAVLLVSYFIGPAPPAPTSNPQMAVNLNFVYGLSYTEPQTLMAPWLWFTMLLVGFPVAFYLPAHLMFRAWFPAATAGDAGRRVGVREDEEIAPAGQSIVLPTKYQPAGVPDSPSS